MSVALSYADHEQQLFNSATETLKKFRHLPDKAEYYDTVYEWACRYLTQHDLWPSFSDAFLQHKVKDWVDYWHKRAVTKEESYTAEQRTCGQKRSLNVRQDKAAARRRKVVLFYAWRALSVREIEAKTGIPKSTVHRDVQKLRAEYLLKKVDAATPPGTLPTPGTRPAPVPSPPKPMTPPVPTPPVPEPKPPPVPEPAPVPTPAPVPEPWDEPVPDTQPEPVMAEVVAEGDRVPGQAVEVEAVEAKAEPEPVDRRRPWIRAAEEARAKWEKAKAAGKNPERKAQAMAQAQAKKTRVARVNWPLTDAERKAGGPRPIDPKGMEHVGDIYTRMLERAGDGQLRN